MFTNWLTSEVPSKSREPSNPPPDVIVEVGPPPFARFPAHSAVLSSQSGFFRAAIQRTSEVGKLSENPIYLPNISVEHFTPLLTYMYTGFLELNFENIFGVLLATHLLHMPRAVEICRDFLARMQRQQSDFYSAAVPQVTSSKVIRPIASKASSIGLNFVSPPKAPTSLLLPSLGTPFKSITVSPTEEIPTKICKIQESPSADNKSQVEKIIKVAVPMKKPESSDCEKVIVDIASCDGPVRFRRVLNDAYEKSKKQNSEPVGSSDLTKSNVLSFHQQMLRNINEQYKQKALMAEESENSQHSGDLYTCVYCKHTFKSKYCYQKHAKRHINPLGAMGKCRDDCESTSDCDKEQSTSTKRDSIKPLDMNVQYYPCKTCGCKFPSYYFVHKHRKMCHPEVGGEGSVRSEGEEKDGGKEGGVEEGKGEVE